MLCRDDLEHISEDVAHLWVEHGDIQSENIIQAGKPEWRIWCPRHQYEHCYRFINFSHAFKRELTYEQLMLHYDNIRRFTDFSSYSPYESML